MDVLSGFHIPHTKVSLTLILPTAAMVCNARRLPRIPVFTTFVIFFCLWAFSYSQMTRTSKRAEKDDFELSRDILGDGKAFDISNCKNLFLDIGSNLGVQVRKLFEPDSYPGAHLVSHFNRHFPMEGSWRTSTCALGFEASPNHAPRHRKMEEIYSKLGWKVLFLSPVAVSTSNGFLDFYIDPPNNSKGGRETEKSKYGFGSSAVPKVWKAVNGKMRIHPEVQNVLSLQQPKVDHVRSTKVRAIDLSEALRPVCKLRKEKQVRVIAKMDIEMSEYRVLPKLLIDGTLCCIDHLFIEWHSSPESPYMLKFEEVFKEMLGSPEMRLSCGVEVHELDDESYAKDGVPWPT